MKIVAKTDSGFLVEATENELKNIQKSLGVSSPCPKLGDNLPVLDYSSQIRNLKEICDSYDMKSIVSHYNSLGETINKFKEASEKLK